MKCKKITEDSVESTSLLTENNNTPFNIFQCNKTVSGFSTVAINFQGNKYGYLRTPHTRASGKQRFLFSSLKYEKI